mmetsp:Transcript_20825/g.41259  ORF Transcript_20825/g.41259 Transcript_20825/m.41259 type:complete len:147 (+) Transcript_20825:32-472(+)
METQSEYLNRYNQPPAYVDCVGAVAPAPPATKNVEFMSDDGNRGLGGAGGGGNGTISAEDIQGCWACFAFPFFCSLFRKKATGPDRLLHQGCCCIGCVPLCPFTEERHRNGPDGFVKTDEPGNVDRYSSNKVAGQHCSISLRLYGN